MERDLDLGNGSGTELLAEWTSENLISPQAKWLSVLIMDLNAHECSVRKVREGLHS